MHATHCAGLILAGGRSTRMGGRDKAFVTLAGRPLIAHAVSRLKPQVDTLLINSNADPARFAPYNLPVVPDILTGYHGPLAGIHAGLTHAPDVFLATTAVDIPFLPDDLVARLRAGIQTARCAYASNGHQHALALLWAPGALTLVEEYLASGERSIKRFLAEHGARVLFDRPGHAGLFHNINTPEDLARAEIELSQPQMNADERR
jgi:molybdopterin-guanine dinucleotide biosynthesis protein A